MNHGIAGRIALSSPGPSPARRLALREGHSVDPNGASRTERQIEWLLRLRRERSDMLGQDLFADPAWDILLQLFAAKLRGRIMKLTDLVSDAPPTTLARWAAVLEERGLVFGHLDPLIPSDLRIELSAWGAVKLSKLLHSLGHLHPVD